MRKKLQLFLSLCLVLFTSLGTTKAQSLPAFPHRSEEHTSELQSQR